MKEGKMFKFLTSIFITLFLTVGAYGQTAQDFIKYEPGTGLEVAVTDFVSPVNSQVITLYSTVHIAEHDYYKAVQKDLDTYDAVLYEGVGGDKQKMAQQAKTPSMLSTIQGLMGDVLGLEFQLDNIDYTRKNLVHADVGSMDELKEKMNGESITPMGNYINEDQLASFKPVLDVSRPILKQILKAFPDLQNSIKAKFADSLANTDITTKMSPELRKALLQDRNEIVIKVLNDQLQNHPDHKKLAIFFGGAHMVDLKERLQKMGFKESNKRWMTAWKIEKVESTEDDSNDLTPVPTPEKPKQHRQSDNQKEIPDNEDK
jgi:hypothetical protein